MTLFARIIAHRVFIRYVRWRWLIRVLYARRHGWELELASDDLMDPDVLARVREG